MNKKNETRKKVPTISRTLGHCQDRFWPGSTPETARRLVDKARAEGVELTFTDDEGMVMRYTGRLKYSVLDVCDQRGEICRLLQAESR